MVPRGRRRGGPLPRRDRADALSRCGWALAAAMALALASAVPGQAQTPSENDRPSERSAEVGIGPYLILRADEVTFDENTGLAVASGNVEIAHGERLLKADRVTYHQESDTFTATGNVAMVEPNGDVIFGENLKLTNRFKDGFIKGFRMLFKDNSRLAATGGRRVGGIVSTLNKAVFSPCDLCKDDPERAPLWRIRSVRVTHDSRRKEIEYEDAVLEMFGVPVAYLPYLSQPDPTVDRRSGILAPSYGSDSDLGLTLSVPYHWVISPSEDITITPTIYTNENPMLATEYRRRFAHGEIEAQGSITQARTSEESVSVDDSDVRGHLLAKGRFDIDPIWRTKFQLQHASDDTYMRRYDFDQPNNQTLTTSFNIEGFKGHNYAQLSGFHFQGLREDDDQGLIPVVLPFAEHHFTSRPLRGGSYLTADTTLLAMHREESNDTRRLSMKGGWHLPHTGSTGEVYEVSATLQGDLYWVNDLDTGTELEDGVTGRLFPQLMFKWRYPFVRKETRATQLVEPIAALILAPNGGNSSDIPNEDSLDVEFDDTNLFSPNRFTGVDRVEDGQRFVYGLNWGLYGDRGGALEAFLGQSYRFQPNTDFSEDSGLREKASDLVGRLRISPASYLDFLYRFRFDTEDLTARRSDVRVAAGPPGFRVNVNYFFVEGGSGTGEFPDREEITVGLNTKLSQYWSANAYIREDLTEDGGTISEAIGLTYQDECFTFNINFERTFTEDRDLKPKDTLFLQLIFKHLGEFKAS